MERLWDAFCANDPIAGIVTGSNGLADVFVPAADKYIFHGKSIRLGVI
jgi:hypothetical protein